jgi:hypothetical protein
MIVFHTKTVSSNSLQALLRGIPEEGAVLGTDDFLNQSGAFALGFFVFEVRDSWNMYLAHGVTEKALMIHHLIGVILYAYSLVGRWVHAPRHSTFLPLHRFTVL